MATDVSIERAPPRSVTLPHGALALAGLAGTAGFIHLVALIEHVGEEWSLVVFFAAVGSAQLAAAWRIYQGAAGRRLLTIVALGSVAVALLWLVSRTSGLSFGPETGRRAVGVGDTIATMLELLFAGIVGLLLWRGEQRLAWLSGGMGIRLTFALLSLALMLAAFGGHEH